MNLWTRSMIALVVLGAGLVAQSALWWHVNSAPPLEDVELPQRLEQMFAKDLGDWVGEDVEVQERAKYGDDYLKRQYVHKKTGQPVYLWIAYSRAGEDRGHHPEICMAAAGQREDPAGRGELEMPGGEAKIQQYRYARSGQNQWVYYWYYTLRSPQAGEIDAVQRLYQYTQRRESSMTMEVFATELPGQEEPSRQAAVEFVKQVEAIAREKLPSTAVRGSRRIPVKIVEAG